MQYTQQYSFHSIATSSQDAWINYYSLRSILIDSNIDVSSTKICLDTSGLESTKMERREYDFYKMQLSVNKKTVISSQSLQSKKWTCYSNITWHIWAWHERTHDLVQITCRMHLHMSYGSMAIIMQRWQVLSVSAVNTRMHFSNSVCIKQTNPNMDENATIMKYTESRSNFIYGRFSCNLHDLFLSHSNNLEIVYLKKHYWCLSSYS